MFSDLTSSPNLSAILRSPATVSWPSMYALNALTCSARRSRSRSEVKCRVTSAMPLTGSPVPAWPEPSPSEHIQYSLHWSNIIDRITATIGSHFVAKQLQQSNLSQASHSSSSSSNNNNYNHHHHQQPSESHLVPHKNHKMTRSAMIVTKVNIKQEEV